MVALMLSFLLLLVNFNGIYASLKTGVGVSPNIDNLNCDDFNVLTSPVWWYNWGNINNYKHMNCTQLRDIEFIPMMWGWYGGDFSQINIPDETTTILGFNEPNIVGQAQLEPADAVQGWKALQTTFSDKILVGPSASPCSGTNCYGNWTQQAWFDEFFRLCNGTCSMDFMSVHLYWCYINNAQFNVYDWRGSLWNIYNRYGYKLWLTEFNCWGANTTQQQIFMEAVIPVIESTDWIEKYAWFMARHLDYGDDILLFTQNTSEAKLTNLGKTYNKYSLSPTTSPTLNPTMITSPPTNNPSVFPTNNPTKNPSQVPTDNPTKNPTYTPSAVPTDGTPNPVMDTSTDNVQTLHSFTAIFVINLCWIFVY